MTTKHAYKLVITMQVSCSYRPQCSSLALPSAQDSSKQNSLVVQVGPFFSQEAKIFRKQWSARTDILVPWTNFSLDKNFCDKLCQHN